MENSSSVWDMMWIIDLYFTCMSVDTIIEMPYIYTMPMHKYCFKLFWYIWIVIWMSSFITGLGFLLVDLPLRLELDGPYIFSVFLISATDIVNVYIILTETMCLKLFIIGSLHYCIFFWLTWTSLFVCL